MANDDAKVEQIRKELRSKFWTASLQEVFEALVASELARRDAEAKVAKAVEDEREACAKEADCFCGHPDCRAKRIAAAIRARRGQ